MLAAYIFTLLTSVVVLFQLALALGAPWGEWAMGGKFPGKYPPQLRIAALVQMGLLIFCGAVVISRAGLAWVEYAHVSRYAIWFVVVLFIISAILNNITPSKKERMLWGPVTIVLVICSFVVALD